MDSTGCFDRRRVGCRRRLLRIALCVGLGAVLAPGGLVAAAGDAGYARIAPILQARCVVCHQGEGAPLGLRLDSLEGLLAGSQRGPVVRAGDPEDSELIRRLDGRSNPRMPLTGPPWLDEREMALIADFIREAIADRADGVAEFDAASAMAAEGADPGAVQPSPPTGSWPAVAVIFGQRCAKCHAAQGLLGGPPEGYRLSTHAEAVDASERARIVPGRPEASELWRRVTGLARPRMPLDGPPYLGEAELAQIEAWIRAGAADGEGRATPVARGAEVRLHGTLESANRLDGLSFLAPAERKRVDGHPGDYVRLRGRLGPEGEVLAERIQAR